MLFGVTCLTATVSAAPMIGEALQVASEYWARKQRAADELVKEPALNAFRKEGTWVVDPPRVPAPCRSQHVRERLDSRRVEVEQTSSGVRIQNSGPRPLLARFGIREKTYVVQPGTSETIADVTAEELTGLALYRVPSNQPIKYHEEVAILRR